MQKERYGSEKMNSLKRMNQVTDMCMRLMMGKREVIEQLQMLPNPLRQVTGTAVSIQLENPK